MALNGRIHRVSLFVGLVLVVTLQWTSTADAQRPKFDPNGRNTRLSWYSDLNVRDYPEPGAGSRSIVGAEVVASANHAGRPERHLLRGDIVDRIGGVPVQGAIHFARLWHELPSMAATEVRVRRGGTVHVMRLTGTRSVGGDYPYEPFFFSHPSLEMYATEHFEATLHDLNPSLQACLKRSRGVLVTEVQPHGPSAFAGLRAGDILVRVQGRSFADADELDKIVGPKPGTLTATVVREGKEIDLMPFSPAAVREARERRPHPDPGPGASRFIGLLGLEVQDTRGGLRVYQFWPGSRGARSGLTDRDLITSVAGVRVTSAEVLARWFREAVRPSTLQLGVSGPTGTRTVDIALPVRRLPDEDRTLAESIDAMIEPGTDGGVQMSWVKSPGRSETLLGLGDKLVTVAGEPAITVAQVLRIIAEWPANRALTMRIVRKDATESVEVVVVPRAVEDQTRRPPAMIHDDFNVFREPDVLLHRLAPAFGAAVGVSNGVFVLSVAHGSNAEQRGLRGCDVITQVDGQDLPDPLDEKINVVNWVSKNIVRALTVRREGKNLVIW